MSKPRYNGASPCRGVTYQWFSFISFVNVWGEWPSQKALIVKALERKSKEEKKCCAVKRVSVKKDIGGRYNKEADSSSELQIERNESLIHFCWFWKQPFTTQQRSEWCLISPETEWLFRG